jgi:hypothetical protein
MFLFLLILAIIVAAISLTIHGLKLLLIVAAILAIASFITGRKEP